MQALLIGGALALILAIAFVWLIVHLAKQVGAKAALETVNKAVAEKRHDADDVLAEQAANEEQWLRDQIRMAQRVGGRDPAFTMVRQHQREKRVEAPTADREHLKRVRELARRASSRPGRPVR